MRVTVVTPTLGEATLRQAAASVQEQTWPVLAHLVVVDGPDAEQASLDALSEVDQHEVPRHVISLPYRVGGPDTFGHKAYAAAAYLAPLETDVICMLDADNWYDPDHVAEIVNALARPGVTWAYSLRKVVDPQGRFLCRDDCDSLGSFERGIVADVGTGRLSDIEDAFYRVHRFHVDVNCYALPVKLLQRVGPELLTGRRADSVLACRLLATEASGGTGRYSVNYRLGSTTAGPESYYRAGNDRMRQRYPDGFPWARSA